MKKKNIGIAVVSVPILAAGTVALASSYRDSTDFKPSDTEQELQVNQVVFDGNESGAGHSRKNNGDESHLLKKIRMQMMVKRHNWKIRQIIFLKTVRCIQNL